jgi:hypothetical protein
MSRRRTERWLPNNVRGSHLVVMTKVLTNETPASPSIAEPSSRRLKRDGLRRSLAFLGRYWLAALALSSLGLGEQWRMPPAEYGDYLHNPTPRRYPIVPSRRRRRDHERCT